MRFFRPLAVLVALVLPALAVPASGWADVTGNPNVSTFVPVGWNPFTGVQIHNVFWTPGGAPSPSPTWPRPSGTRTSRPSPIRCRPGLVDHNAAGPVTGSVVDFLHRLLTDPGGLFAAVRTFLGAHAEIGDLCEDSSPYTSPQRVPHDFAFVPATLSNTPVSLASYWSNSAHACVVGGDRKRVVAATFSAQGLPPGTGTVVVQGPTADVGPPSTTTGPAHRSTSTRPTRNRSPRVRSSSPIRPGA